MSKPLEDYTITEIANHLLKLSGVFFTLEQDDKAKVLREVAGLLAQVDKPKK